MLKQSVPILLLLACLCYSAPTGTTKMPSTTTQTILKKKFLRHLVVANKLNVENNRLRIGVSFAHAEQDCQNMIKLTHTPEMSPVQHGIIRSVLKKIFSDLSQGSSEPEKLRGHLVAIRSYPEFKKLKRYLAALPKGPYWTGGKLVRFRNNSRVKNTHDHKLTLSWTDGSSSNPYDLGINEKKAKELKEGKEYCLALNTRLGQWQARNCEDRIPYACLVENEKPTTKATTTKSSQIISSTMSPSTIFTGSSTTGSINNLSSTTTPKISPVGNTATNKLIAASGKVAVTTSVPTSTIKVKAASGVSKNKSTFTTKSSLSTITTGKPSIDKASNKKSVTSTTSKPTTTS